MQTIEKVKVCRWCEQKIMEVCSHTWCQQANARGFDTLQCMRAYDMDFFA